MNKLSIFKPAIAFLFSAALITGCSGGGGGGNGNGGTSGVTYNGNTAPASIEASNAEEIGNASGESVQTANSSTNLPGAITVSSSIDMEQINNIVISTTNSLNLPAGLDIPGVCDNGSASVPNSATPPVSGAYNVTVTYSNCEVTGTTITVNGTASVHYDDIADLNAGFSITYTNFTVTDPINGTTTINLNFSCTSLSDINSCTYSSDFIGNDGITHRVTDFNITGDGTSGFNGTATFFHGTFGEVSITITNVTYGSCNPYPDGGDISFVSSNSSSGTIIFNSDCTVSGTWDNGTGGAGAF